MDRSCRLEEFEVFDKSCGSPYEKEYECETAVVDGAVDDVCNAVVVIGGDDDRMCAVIRDADSDDGEDKR